MAEVTLKDSEDPKIAILKDFDEPEVYKDSTSKLSDPVTRNFVVQFGQYQSTISFDLDGAAFKLLLNENKPPRVPDQPVRWINLWAPNKQHDVVNVIGQYYGLTDRFKAILQSNPKSKERKEDHGNDPAIIANGGAEKGQTDKRQGRECGLLQKTDRGDQRSSPVRTKYDVEKGMNGMEGRLKGELRRKSDRDNRHRPELRANNDNELASANQQKRRYEGPSHYDIASNLINYQLVDQGERFLCVGANWIYNSNEQSGENRLFSWLFLCTDSTVISIQEDPQEDPQADQEDPQADQEDPEANHEITSPRGHIIDVLKQISTQHPKNGSVSVISVRTSLGTGVKDAGFYGSSNLFYYLFDNWHTTYSLILGFKSRLGQLGKEILEELDQKYIYDTNKKIIPEIYRIGNELRRNQHLYEGYKNLIDRILECKVESPTSEDNQIQKRIKVESSAIHRFNRLHDHIKLLVLSSLTEAIEEKDALLTTYFNITAQKDSQATSKLSRNSTLLSKLGILFIPVSLVTSYFSIQIQELQGVYTAKTYWVSFTVTLVLSFIVLFLFSRFLVHTMERIQRQLKETGRHMKLLLGFKKNTNVG